MNTPVLLRGVDLAAFAAALVARLRGAGVLVSANGQASFVQALRLLVPHTTSALYWAARLTLVNRMEDLSAFDALFSSVFGATEPDGVSSPDAPLPIPGPKTPAPPAAGTVHRAGSRSAAAQTLPWATRTGTAADGTAGSSVLVPDVLAQPPSRTC